MPETGVQGTSKSDMEETKQNVVQGILVRQGWAVKELESGDASGNVAFLILLSFADKSSKPYTDILSECLFSWTV